MGLIDEELLAAVAATAAVASPRLRRVARRGVVYGLAGALMAGDVAIAAARGVARAAGPQDAATGGERAARRARPQDAATAGERAPRRAGPRTGAQDEAAAS